MGKTKIECRKCGKICEVLLKLRHNNLCGKSVKINFCAFLLKTDIN